LCSAVDWPPGGSDISTKRGGAESAVLCSHLDIDLCDRLAAMASQELLYERAAKAIQTGSQKGSVDGADAERARRVSERRIAAFDELQRAREQAAMVQAEAYERAHVSAQDRANQEVDERMRNIAAERARRREAEKAATSIDAEALRMRRDEEQRRRTELEKSKRLLQQKREEREKRQQEAEANAAKAAAAASLAKQEEGRKTFVMWLQKKENHRVRHAEERQRRQEVDSARIAEERARSADVMERARAAAEREQIEARQRWSAVAEAKVPQVAVAWKPSW
jgi:hypothetical protein